MRFNSRKKDVNGHDLPPDQGGYEELLTAMYGDLSTEFPVLHELSEAAKLSLVAEWIHSREPSLRLPSAGRTAWSAPSRVPGFVYLYLRSRDDSDQFDTTIIPTGGVALSPFPPGNAAARVNDIAPSDTSVVDLRDTDVGKALIQPVQYDNQTLSRILHRQIEVPEWHPQGWIGRATKGDRTIASISVIARELRDSTCDSVETAAKLQQLLTLAEQLSRTEKQINAINAKAPDRFAEYARLDDDLSRDSDVFRQQTISVLAQDLFGMRYELHDGTLKDTAAGVAELRNFLGKVDGWTSRVEALSSADPKRQIRELADIEKELFEEMSMIKGTAAAKYLGPLFKSINMAEKVKIVTDLELGFLKLFLISDYRVDTLEHQTETDQAVLAALMPLQRDLSTKIDALQHDPSLQGALCH
jgi:hypothetical protein